MATENVYNNVVMFNTYRDHIGHKIAVVRYGANDDIQNVSVECEDCCVVLDSFDVPDPEELADHDFFSCEKCSEILDIEDSISVEKMLHCERCAKIATEST